MKPSAAQATQGQAVIAGELKSQDTTPDGKRATAAFCGSAPASCLSSDPAPCPRSGQTGVCALSDEVSLELGQRKEDVEINSPPAGRQSVKVTTDRAHAYPRVLDELAQTAMHNTEQYANSRVEADHGRLKARLRPMRGLKTFRSARILATGHAFVQNLRRGHYDIATDEPAHRRLPAAFVELALAT